MDITRLYSAIKNDEPIDEIIIEDFNPESVEQWKLDNYAMLRMWTYPGYAEYLDAEVKLNSGDTNLEIEGQYQLDKYIADCLNVKLRFPKQ
jgi:hypothetical protein